MHKMTYRYCVADGTPYEVGFQLGSQLSEDKELIKAITTPLFGQPLPQEQVKETAALFEKYIPGINEEIKGFSDAANVSYMDMVIYSSYVNIPGGCSHFVILREDNQRKEIFHARNYDYDCSEPPILITARTGGKYHNTGFSCKVFGRFDGMNEQGLCVTTSSVDIKHTGRMGNGFVFPMIVRAMLEQCSCAYEAKEMLMGMPYAEYRNFLLSDKSGDAILIEVSPHKKMFKNINVEHQYGFLCSSNHFTLEQDSDLQVVKHSVIRQQRMEQVLSDGINMSLEDVKALVGTRYPDGLAFPYYREGMGTLWSAIYEPISSAQHICCGSPESGAWQLMKHSDTIGCTKEEVALNDIEAPKEFWG